MFDDDDSFCSFARHAAATQDDLAGVTDVEGWFDAYPGAKNLTPLKYTSIDSLKTASVEKLSQLECIALPKTLKGVDEKVFQKNTKMRYVDFLQCQNADLMSHLRYGAQSHLGLNEERTLVYMPAAYDNIGETNVIVEKANPQPPTPKTQNDQTTNTPNDQTTNTPNDQTTNTPNTQLVTEKFHLVDSLDYLVPYAFDATSIENSRKLAVSKVPYTICLPYSLNLIAGAVAYKLSERDANKLVFEEVTDNVLEAFRPYLIVVNGPNTPNDQTTNTPNDQTPNIQLPVLDSYKYGALQPIPASTGIRMEQDDVPGYSIRGSFEAISNAEAADLGAYILQSDGNWHPVSTSNQKASILPFRAYLLPSARNAGARTISMSLVDDPTPNTQDLAPNTIETIDKDGTHRYYDLQGREIDVRSAKGIVIKKGKKTIVK